MRLIPRHSALLLFSLLCVGFSPAFSQSAKEVEDRILRDFDRINYLRDRPTNKSVDSLLTINRKLLKYIVKACNNNPELIKADFKRVAVENQMNIVTSEDGRMRIYNWDTQRGGAGNYFDAIVQFQLTDSTTGVSVLNDISREQDGSGESHTGEWYSKIVTVNKKSGHPFYLVQSKAIYTGKDNEYFIDAYMISMFVRKLVPISVFYNKEKARSTISVPYVATGLNDNNPEIRVSGDKQRVFVPVMNQVNEFATGKYDVYVFDGNNYVLDKKAGVSLE